MLTVLAAATAGAFAPGGVPDPRARADAESDPVWFVPAPSVSWAERSILLTCHPAPPVRATGPAHLLAVRDTGRRQRGHARVGGPVVSDAEPGAEPPRLLSPLHLCLDIPAFDLRRTTRLT